MATKRNDDASDKSQLVRVTYPKNSPLENITIAGVGSFTRGGGQHSEPMTPDRAKDLVKRKGFSIVTPDEYAAATEAKKKVAESNNN